MSTSRTVSGCRIHPEAPSSSEPGRFIQALDLPHRVIFHHFSPLLSSSRPSLIHAFLVVMRLYTDAIEPATAKAILTRLFCIVQVLRSRQATKSRTSEHVATYLDTVSGN